MSTYAMSDIYGYHDKFLEMLNLIKYDSDDCLVLVGNSIDCNNLNSVEIIKWILNNTKVDYNKIFVLLGQNEDKFIKELNNWSNNDYNNYNLSYYNIINTLLLDGIGIEQLKNKFCYMRWSLPLKRWNFANSCTCNGFFNNLSKTNYVSQKDFSIYSTYDDIINYGGVVGYKNVFGHYPTVLYYINDSDKGKIVKFDKNKKHFININCGIYLPNNEGRLGCICVDDESEYYVT